MEYNPTVEKRQLINSRLNTNTNWFLSMAGSKCDIFEKNWLDCASKQGLARADMDCKMFKDDLKECSNMEIAIKRYHRMQEERQKKGLPYQDPPPYDTLNFDKYKTPVF